MEEENNQNIFNPLANITDVKTPEQSATKYLANSIKTNAQSKNPSLLVSDLHKATQADFSFGNFSTSEPKQFQLQKFDTRVEEVYDTLSDGELVNMYGDNTFFKGTDNMERIAQSQTSGEKWANGIYKFGTGTLNAVVGGTVGTVNGVFEMINQGSLNAFYDNDFNSWLEDSNKKTSYEFYNAYTKQEQDLNFFEQLGTANLWADKVLGAASFTVGAIVSEGIWAWATGGASLAGSFARQASKLGKFANWGKKASGVANVAKGTAKYKSWLKEPLYGAFKKAGLGNKSAVIGASRAGQGLNTTRFLLTSSGYEAGVEAMHYKKEAEENFYDNFQQINGRLPNQEEVNSFEEQLENSSNAVFGGNMALLAASNAAMFGSLFNIKNPLKSSTKSINKNLFGIGTKEVKDKAGSTVVEALEATKKQKIFSGSFAAGKPIITEAIWEEGGQSSLSKAAGHWLESGYDPKYNSTNVSLINAMYEGMSETYGTKEGWAEMGVGAIIGGGSSVIQGKGKFKELKDIQEQREYQKDVVAKGMNTFSEDTMVKRMVMNNKIQNAVDRQKKANAEGNLVESKLAEQDTLIAEMEFTQSIGENVEDLVKKYQTALDNVDADVWQEAEIEDVDGYKKTTLESYSNLVKRYKKNAAYSRAIFGIESSVGEKDARMQYSDALAYVLTTGENAYETMEDTLAQMEEQIGSERVKSIKISSTLSLLDENTKKDVEKTNSRISQITKVRDKLVESIQDLQQRVSANKDDKRIGKTLGDVNQRLIEVENELQTLVEKREVIADKINEEATRRKGVNESSTISKLFIGENITGKDLENIEKKLTDIDSYIGSYKGVDNRVYSSLLDLSKNYKDSKERFLDAQNAAIALSSGEVKYKGKNVGGLIGKVFGNTKKENSFTEEFLADLSELHKQYFTKGLNETLNEEESTVTQGEVNVEESIEKFMNPTLRDSEVATSSKEGVERLREELNEILEKRFYNLGYTGDSVEELSKKRPSQEDVERYIQLLGKDRLAEEQIEFDSLSEKLSEWKVLSSSVTNGKSIADILTLINQLETQIEENSVNKEVTLEDRQEVSDELGQSSDSFDSELTQNTTGNVMAKLDKTTNQIKFSHLEAERIYSNLDLEKIEIIDSRGNIIVKAGNLDDLKNYSKAGYTLRLTTSQGLTLDLEITPSRAIKIDYKTFVTLQDNLNLYIVDTGNRNWSYKDVYEIVGDSMLPKKSDFAGDDISEQGIYEVEVGEEVEFYYDSQDEWNLSQKEQIEKDRQNKKLSEEALKEREESYKNNIKIYIQVNGKNVGTLKATNSEDASEALLLIREQAYKVSESGQNTVFGKTEVTQVVLGSSKLFNLTKEGVSTTPISERASEEVITTGYILDNEFVLADKTLESVDQSFVGKISSNKKGVKIPVVVFQKGAHTIAYPVTLVETNSSKKEELYAIISDKNLSEQEKVQAVNNLLISNNINPSKFNLIDLKDTVKLENIEKELEAVTDYVDMDTFSSAEYDVNNLTKDVGIDIDLEDLNQSISSPKIKIDLKGYTLYEERDYRYDAMTQVEEGFDNLASLLREITLNSRGDFVDSKGDTLEGGLVDTEFQENNAYIINPENHLDILHNVAMVLRVYEALIKPKNKADKKVVELLGQDNIEEVKKLKKTYDFLKNRLKTPKNINSTVEDLTCKK